MARNLVGWGVWELLSKIKHAKAGKYKTWKQNAKSINFAAIQYFKTYFRFTVDSLATVFRRWPE